MGSFWIVVVLVAAASIVSSCVAAEVVVAVESTTQQQQSQPAETSSSKPESSAATTENDPPAEVPPEASVVDENPPESSIITSPQGNNNNNNAETLLPPLVSIDSLLNPIQAVMKNRRRWDSGAAFRSRSLGVPPPRDDPILIDDTGLDYSTYFDDIRVARPPPQQQRVKAQRNYYNTPKPAVVRPVFPWRSSSLKTPTNKPAIIITPTAVNTSPGDTAALLLKIEQLETKFNYQQLQLANLQSQLSLEILNRRQQQQPAPAPVVKQTKSFFDKKTFKK